MVHFAYVCVCATFQTQSSNSSWAIYFSETAGDQIDDLTQHYAGAVIHHRCRQL